MPKIIFLGQNPSKANIDPKVPFLGTKSYATLQKWIFELGLKEEDCEFYNASEKIGKVTLKDVDRSTMEFIVNKSLDPDYCVICLGQYAKKTFLKHWNRYPLIFYTLLHPSGLNRTLNDKRFVEMELIKCKAFIKANF